MRNEKIKRYALPIGLLLVNGTSLIEIFAKVDIPDIVQGFFMGTGIAIMFLGLKCQHLCQKNV